MKVNKRLVSILVVAAGGVAIGSLYPDFSADPMEPIRPFGEPGGTVYRADRGEIWRIDSLNVQGVSLQDVRSKLRGLSERGWEHVEPEVAKNDPEQTSLFMPTTPVDVVLFVRPDKNEWIAAVDFDGAILANRTRKLSPRERAGVWLRTIASGDTSIPEQKISL